DRINISSVSSKSLRSSTLQRNTDLWFSWFALVADPRFAVVYAKGSSGRDLDQTEFSQFFILGRALLYRQLRVLRVLPNKLNQGLGLGWVKCAQFKQGCTMSNKQIPGTLIELKIAATYFTQLGLGVNNSGDACQVKTPARHGG